MEIPIVNPNAKGKYYKRTYEMNAVGRDGKTTTVAIPRDVLKRKAEEKGLTPKQFIDTHRVIAVYNSFDGVFLSFEEKSEYRDLR